NRVNCVGVGTTAFGAKRMSGLKRKSEKGHKRSFDHLVGDGEECPRQLNPERLGRLQIDDKLELMPMRGNMVSPPSGPKRSRPCSRSAMSSTLRTTTNPGATKLPGRDRRS